MASKVMVKLPVTPFGQVNKSKGGAVSSEVVLQKHLMDPATNNEEEQQDPKTPEQVRLEQNIKFLQDQHQAMLNGLQGEIERLKTKNRELQFQLIFGKTPVASSSSSPSSPEDEKHKLYTSPRVLNNTTPLQVELLEKELGELKMQMTEQESRNVYLSAIVDEQKKQLERYDRRREKEQQQQRTPGDAEAELLRKLEDAETLIRQLRRENSDLRRENQEMQQNESTAHGQERRGYRGGGGRGHRSGGHNNGYYNGRGGGGGGGWFPPVHTQNFWQGGRTQHQHERPLDGPNLPELPSDGAASQHYHHQGNHGRKGGNNNHHYHQNGEGRKYRGGHKGGKPS
ncbi:hrp65 protein-like isoform X2 [Anthonomus grandis grandis]|uniref:hrp65 protein-like isoform X2 n=1 Tax=Anthonomus grandis grandis TaxID=2921223 RepID=UPI0021652E88|nr:hrp65 protein-like isoform X2 [Anthonomus grandis grandis]